MDTFPANCNSVLNAIKSCGFFVSVPSTGWHYLTRLGWFLQVPSRRHDRSASPEEQEAFKKNSSNGLKSSNPSPFNTLMKIKSFFFYGIRQAFIRGFTVADDSVLVVGGFS